MPRNKEDPWLYDSYGDEPETPEDMDFFDMGDFRAQRRNQQMIRQGEGYYNSRGRAVKVRNPPRVQGRRWGLLLEKYGDDA